MSVYHQPRLEMSNLYRGQKRTSKSSKTFWLYLFVCASYLPIASKSIPTISKHVIFRLLRHCSRHTCHVYRQRLYQCIDKNLAKTRNQAFSVPQTAVAEPQNKQKLIKSIVGRKTRDAGTVIKATRSNINSCIPVQDDTSKRKSWIFLMQTFQRNYKLDVFHANLISLHFKLETTRPAVVHLFYFCLCSNAIQSTHNSAFPEICTNPTARLKAWSRE